MGLSPKICDDQQAHQRFEVAGPMGHGLRCDVDGLHIAFAAGTGALCFTDLVAQIAFFNTGRRENESSIN